MDTLLRLAQSMRPVSAAGVAGSAVVAVVGGVPPGPMVAVVAVASIARFAGHPELFVRWAIALGREPTRAQRQYLLSPRCLQCAVEQTGNERPDDAGVEGPEGKQEEA